MQGDKVRAVRGHEHGLGTVVVQEVLPGVLPRALTMIYSRFAKRISSTPEVVVILFGSQGRIFIRFDLVW